MNIFRKLFKKKKKTLGIALGSGGAKGMAHIGILRAFDEENISFDFVAGTSIGSVVGAMYAAGYSSASMVGYLKEVDLFALTNLVKYTIAGKTVESVFDDVVGGAAFEDLSLPYAAIAADLKTGEQVVIKSGKVSKAMRASSAVPPMLKPVEVGGRILVDGACVDSVPADVVKNMGADFVVGVNLSSDDDTNVKMKTTLDEKYPGHGVKFCDRFTAGRKFSDYILAPDLKNYSAGTISREKLEEMYEIGYELAKAKMPEIKALLKKKNII